MFDAAFWDARYAGAAETRPRTAVDPAGHSVPIADAMLVARRVT